ncbi:unnamed protein product [Camellia sinensis]
MGLSTKQVSSDGHDWGDSLLQSGSALEIPKPPVAVARRLQLRHQQSEPLACPRCGSKNTKFCYYNNYNESQPRHFCKACKRHWTKGGTLRNVPVGGGRKNKRLKTATTTTTSTTTATTTATTATTSSRSNTHMGIQNQQELGGDQKNISEILYQAFIHPPHDSINGSGNFNLKSFSGNNGNFLGSTLPFTFSSLSSFESDPSSIPTSFRSSDCYEFSGGLAFMEEEDRTITTFIPTTTSIATQPWQVVPTTSSVMDMPNYWNWDDIDTLVSTHELNIPWDDHDTDLNPKS